MNILDLFNSSVELLESQDIDTARLDVKVLLSHTLGIEPNLLITHINDEIDGQKLEEFYTKLERRKNREPIANIINKKAFWEYEFFVNADVLTPRNDSETLIEAVLENYRDMESRVSILDICTGSGCLVLTLLKIYKNAVATATDISDKALKIANKNAKLLDVKNINFKKTNLTDGIDDRFDIIISNPPYIPSDEIKTLSPEVNQHNPMIALDGGQDGLFFYREIAKSVSKNVKPHTRIFLEIGKGQELDVERIFNIYGFVLCKNYRDLGGVVRVLVFVSKNKI